MSRIAVVTGASRLDGMGASICLKLADQGCDIFFTGFRGYDRNMPWGAEEESFEKLEGLIREKGVKCQWEEIDFMSEDGPERVMNIVTETMGKPSILINNAAYSTETTIDSLTGLELDRHYTVNVRSACMLTIKFFEVCESSAGGRVIFLTSGQSLGPMPNELAYAVTKSSVEAFVKSAATSVASKGITINAVNPGPTQTGWIVEEFKEELLGRFPMGRLGIPEDTAKLIAFLVSSEAQWITGQVIHSEGGFIR
ncbi:SDR family oxidoreductase [Bacillus sp. SG-1]|uniref:SDR family oxidoreductase n=1 Tax=Bacillus sp. SG-1 TaxID=161544 RepID=UPI0001543764|nr:SDR family oxidoreductase [Bacillus sp. SG-1]EDL66136.1 3-ketoacyl-(acyl-carrier-protein) reductase [Bacillus sp. SG-1]